MTSTSSSPWLPPAITRLASKLFGTPPLLPSNGHGLTDASLQSLMVAEPLSAWLLRQWQESPQLLPSLLIQGITQWLPTCQNVLVFGQQVPDGAFQCLARKGMTSHSVPFEFLNQGVLEEWANATACQVFASDRIVWLLGDEGQATPQTKEWTQLTSLLLNHWLDTQTHQNQIQQQAVGLALRQTLLTHCYSRNVLIQQCMVWLGQAVEPCSIRFWQRCSLSQSQMEAFSVEWHLGVGLLQSCSAPYEGDLTTDFIEEPSTTTQIPTTMDWLVDETGHRLILPLSFQGQSQLVGWFVMEFNNGCFDLPAQVRVTLEEAQPLMSLALMNAWQYDQALLLANLDELTGLVNRRGFYQRFELELDRIARHERPLCVALVDVDHFKLLNDTYGHLVGDQVLQQLTAVMMSKIRKTDLLARFGGEEFALLLPEMSESYAFELLDRLRAAVANQVFEVDDTRQKFPLRVTISAGFTLATSDKLTQRKLDWSPTISNLLAEADAYLYEAKSHGRDQIVFHPLEKPA